MLDMDIIAHVAAALGPLASPIGNFLVFDFWTPPLLSILYMGLTSRVLTYPNLWPQRSAQKVS